MFSIKSNSHLRNFFFFYFNEHPLKTMKKAFYFMVKALFVFETFTFSSRRLSHIQKQLDEKTMANFKMYYVLHNK